MTDHDASTDLALDLQDTLLRASHYDLRIIAEQLILAKGWRKLPRLDYETELPNVREKWMASLGMALGDLLTLEVGRRGAGELLALFHDDEQTHALLTRDLNSETERADRAEALAEQYRRDSIDYRDNWRIVSAENGSLQAHLALKREQVQRQQARADSATAALDRVRKFADELESTPVVGASSPEQWEFDTRRAVGRELREALEDTPGGGKKPAQNITTCANYEAEVNTGRGSDD